MKAKRLTFRFFKTEQDARQNIEWIFKNYTPYMKRKYKKPNTHLIKYDDGSGGWIVWYYV